MKIASKVFIWLSIIICSLSEIFFIIAGFANDKMSYSFAGLFLTTLVPIIVGICSLYRISSYKNKDELIAVGIITLLFCSVLGGAFMLAIPDNKIKEESNHSNTYFGKYPKNNNDFIKNDNESNIEEQQDDCDIEGISLNRTNQAETNKEKKQDLESLKELYQDGIINQEEYKTAALEIINKKY